MNVNINSDSSISISKEHIEEFAQSVNNELHRFDEQITRVELHLSDENGNKSGVDDKRCLMEARLAGLAPIAVSHHGATLTQAIDGAAAKLKRALDAAVDRRRP